MKTIPLSALIGRKFGRLTVISESAPYRYKNGSMSRKFLCRCNCENYVVVRMSDLKNGKTQSCGCLNKEKTSELKKTHNLHDTNLYSRWKNIKKRCLNKNYPEFYNYGGRGITICDEWRNDFKSFYDWAMANGYSSELTIDRINNDGNYEPSNCRFVTQAENNRNQRVRKDRRS